MGDGILKDVSIEVQRESLHSEIARKLIDHLVSTSEFRPGSRLPSERELARLLGVGRSVVRETLKSLTLIGLLEVRQGSGTYLRQPESELLPKVIEWGLLLGERSVSDLIEARRVVEVALAGFAATRRSDDQIAVLEQRMDAMRVSTSSDEFVEADIGFHLAVAAAGGNAVLVDVLSSIQALLRVWIRRVIDAAGETDTSRAEHEPILAAIQAGDPEAASAAMADHLTKAFVRLEHTLE